MRAFIYYALMLLLGFYWYRLGQNLLRKGPRDENGKLTEGIVGPIGFLLSGVVACCLFFAVLRALFRGEIPCVGKACAGQVYSLSANAGEYWAILFFIVWLVLALGYAMYVTLKVWFASSAR